MYDIDDKILLLATDCGVASRVEGIMNTLVVFDSLYGNTEQIAKSIADKMKGYGDVQIVRVEPTHPIDLEGVDILIAASPTQGFRPMPAIRDFLAHLSPETLSHVSVACCDTRIEMPWPMNGTAANVMARQLRRKGFVPIVPPESFIVQGTQGPLADGEVERAAMWAETLNQTYATTHPLLVAR